MIEADTLARPLVDDLMVLRDLTRVLPAGLGLAPRLCYLLLAGHANADAVAWPSQKRLADEMGADLSTAWRSLRKLREAGLIVVTSGSGRRPSIYRFVDFRPSTPSAPARTLRRLRVRAGTIEGPRWRDRGSALARSEVHIEVRSEDARDELLDDTPAAFVDAGTARAWLESRRP